MLIPQASNTSSSDGSKGVLFALGAYGWWAWVTPLYFVVLRSVPVLELLAWRVLAGVPTLLLLLWLMGRLGEVRSALLDRRALGTLSVSALLLAVNWFTFVWAVVTDRIAEASLGYYINPLVSVLLGMVFLGERLRGFQVVAIGIAVAGVVVMAFTIGQIPWVSLVIAGAFGFYGFLRKKVDVAPAPGLAVELILLFPIMLVLIAIVQVDTGTAAIAGPWWITTLLLLGGVQTIVPLLFYVGAAKRLHLATLGLLQYIAPTGQLLLAVLLLGEPFGTGSAIAFGLIWAAVIIYSIDSVRRVRQERSAEASISSTR